TNIFAVLHMAERLAIGDNNQLLLAQARVHHFFETLSGPGHTLLLSVRMTAFLPPSLKDPRRSSGGTIIRVPTAHESATRIGDNPPLGGAAKHRSGIRKLK